MLLLFRQWLDITLFLIFKQNQCLLSTELESVGSENYYKLSRLVFHDSAKFILTIDRRRGEVLKKRLSHIK